MTLEDIDPNSEEVQMMNHEQLVLYLARAGISPIDCETSLRRALQQAEEAKTKEAE